VKPVDAPKRGYRCFRNDYSQPVPKRPPKPSLIASQTAQGAPKRAPRSVGWESKRGWEPPTARTSRFRPKLLAIHVRADFESRFEIHDPPQEGFNTPEQNEIAKEKYNIKIYIQKVLPRRLKTSYNRTLHGPDSRQENKSQKKEPKILAHSA